ncbi:1,2-dihydroxy-3-keto-5-methylthiopentene dioxygenase [Mycoemilia scoparia]|uniref:1,2-dihydroxy-3-keto-5-methylthiopentene dioxygenase n=1 Tax=Mycoemilia scoparia TaxID=417184 RepID=A0A9W8A402_9FUNG|nr:1,2-dihydroxy-3-keto-5-methylthiopentene dioxygenase [Mycoemilia scoparia]
MAPNTKPEAEKHSVESAQPPKRQKEAMNLTFPGALDYLYSTWESFKIQQESWEIERARLKTKIIFLTKQNKKLQDIYKSYQQKISFLESALRQSRKQLQDKAFKEKEQPSSTEARKQEDERSPLVDFDIDRIIEVTKQQRGFSEDISKNMAEILKMYDMTPSSSDSGDSTSKDSTKDKEKDKEIMNTMDDAKDIAGTNDVEPDVLYNPPMLDHTTNKHKELGNNEKANPEMTRTIQKDDREEHLRSVMEPFPTLHQKAQDRDPIAKPPTSANEHKRRARAQSLDSDKTPSHSDKQPTHRGNDMIHNQNTIFSGNIRRSSSSMQDNKSTVEHKAHSDESTNPSSRGEKRDGQTNVPPEKKDKPSSTRSLSKISRRTSLPATLIATTATKNMDLRKSRTDPIPSTHFGQEKSLSELKAPINAVINSIKFGTQKKQVVQNLITMGYKPIHPEGRRSLDSALQSVSKSQKLHVDKPARPSSISGRSFDKTSLAADGGTIPMGKKILHPIPELLHCHLDTVRSVDLRIAENGHTQLIVGSEDGLVTLWDIKQTENLEPRLNPKSSFVPHKMFRGHKAAVTSVVFDTDHIWAYSAGMDAGIHVWSLNTTSQRDMNLCSDFSDRVLTGHRDAIWDLSLSKDKNWLASASADGTCAIWNTHSTSLRPVTYLRYNESSKNTITKGAPVPTTLCFLPEQYCGLVVGFSSGAAQLFNPETSQLLVSWTPKSKSLLPGDAINKVAAGRYSKSIAFACSENGRVLLLDTRSSKIEHSWQASKQAITALDVDTEQMQLVTGGTDSVLRWWDVRAHNCYAEDISYTNKGGESISSVRIGPQKHFVATGSADGVVRLYSDDLR